MFPQIDRDINCDFIRAIYIKHSRNPRKHGERVEKLYRTDLHWKLIEMAEFEVPVYRRNSQVS